MAINFSNDVGLAGIQQGNTANRPQSPVLGVIYYNTQLGYFESYTDNGWFAIAAAPTTPTSVVATNVGTSRAYNNGSASVAFTPNTTGGPASSFIIRPSPTTSPATFTGSASPVIATNLASSTQYTYTVVASSPYGNSSESSASSGVTATTVPQAPTIDAVAGFNSSATVTYTAGATGGAAAAFTATSSPGGFTGTGASPITVSGLTNDTAYTFTVTATNSNGTSAASAASSSITPVAGQPDRALFMGGGTFITNASAVTTTDYVAISTTGNATNFGNLITARMQFGGCGSGTRAVLAGGSNTAGGALSSIEYYTIANPGSATSFGSLTNPKTYLKDALSNDTYGMWFGGAINGTLPSETNQMEYVTIATTGNGTLFGTLTRSVFGGSACAGNTTRGIIVAGPYNSGNNYTSIIQYFTWGTSGNTTNFGNAALDLASADGFSSSTRMVYGGGFGVNGVQRSQIEYVEIATTGNATSFGNQTTGRSHSAATSNKTRGLFAGGANSANWDAFSSIEYVTIASTGNGTSFGNMTIARENNQGTSGSHGGLS